MLSLTYGNLYSESRGYADFFEFVSSDLMGQAGDMKSASFVSSVRIRDPQNAMFPIPKKLELRKVPNIKFKNRRRISNATNRLEYPTDIKSSNKPNHKKWRPIIHSRSEWIWQVSIDTTVLFGNTHKVMLNG